MRRYSILFFLPLMLLAGCSHRSTGLLLVENLSGADLHIATNLVSDNAYPNEFDLVSGRTACISCGPAYPKDTDTIPLEDLGNNIQEGFVNLYILQDGIYVLVQSWKYEEKDQAGRQLFNQKYLSLKISDIVSGDRELYYIFSILPEDIGR